MKKILICMLFGMMLLFSGQICSAEQLPGVSIFRITGGGGYNDYATNFVMTCLGKMGSVRAVERYKLNELFREQQYIDAGIVEANGSYMQSVGVDYLIVGDINCQYDSVGRYYVCNAGLRLLSRNGEAVWSTNDRSIGVEIERAIGEALYDCMRNMYEERFPQQGYVFDCKSDGRIYIDVGSLQGIKKGAKFTVSSGRNRVISPRTGKVMSVGGENDAMVKVIKVYPDYCIAKSCNDEGRLIGQGDMLVKKIAGKPRLLGLIGWTGGVVF